VSSQSVIGIKVTGLNGQVFDLVNGTEGVVLSSLKGLELPTFKLQESRTARAPGRRVTGITWDSADLSARVTVADTYLNRPDGRFRTGAEWINLDRAFKGAFSPLAQSLVEVSTPGGTRTYRGRLDELEDVTDGPELLRDIRGRADYDLTLSPDFPFWQGAPVVFDFPYQAVVGDNYYGPGNSAPPFYISKGNSLGGATVINPGDVPAYPTWTITGPAQATVGVGDHLTYVNGLSTGQQITITTDPNAMDVRDENGVRAWPVISSYDFAGIPAGESSNISARIIAGGAGANIRMTLTPNYLSWY
jgi:hypothetical protein